MNKNDKASVLYSWGVFCDNFPQGVDTRGSGIGFSKMLGEGTTDGYGRFMLKFFREQRLVTNHSEYKLREQISYYKRLVSREEGEQAIHAYFDAGRKLYEGRKTPKKAKPATVTADATMVEDETVAIVGEDAPAPMAEPLRAVRKDEGEALLEAARQYARRTDAITSKVAELEALGITIDHDLLTKAIKTEPDPILDAVASLLPMFDRTQRTIEHLSSSDDELRSEVKNLRRENAQMRDNLRAAQEANKRLSERNIALSAEVAERRTVTHA